MSQLIQRYKISQIMRNCKLKQTIGKTYDPKTNSHCFLGALSTEMRERGFIDLEQFTGKKIPKKFMGDIIGKNDIDGLSFAEIADYVEKEYSL